MGKPSLEQSTIWLVKTSCKTLFTAVSGRLSCKIIKVNSTMLKVIMGNDRFALYYWRPRYFGVREVSSTNTCIHVFSFLLAKHGESQPSSAKLLLPIIPIGIVTCAFVLLWDNLCRNNCKQITSLSNTNAPVRFRAKQQASTVHYSSRSTVQNTILFCFA